MFKRLLYSVVGVFGLASMSVHMYYPENNATLVLCEAVQNSSDMSSHIKEITPADVLKESNTQSKKDNMSTYNIHNSSYRSFPPNIIYGTLNAKNPRATSRSAEDTAWWQEHLDNA